MANITFTSPIMHRDKTIYAVAGDTKTSLALADEHKIPIPFECRDGNCGSCLIEVDYVGNKPRMVSMLTEKEKARLKELKVVTAEEIEAAEVNDIPPRHRLACQYIARDEEVRITFTGTPDTSDVNSLSVGANGSANSAQNVAIRLYDEQGNVVKLGEPASAIPLRKGANTLNFSAKYYSPKGGATAGDASAVATYTVTYS